MEKTKMIGLEHVSGFTWPKESCNVVNPCADGRLRRRRSGSLLLVAAAASSMLLATPAHATSFCESLQISATQPHDAQTNVPVDTQVRVLLRHADTCDLTFDGATMMLEAAGEHVPADVVTGTDYHELVPKAPLVANTTYTLTVMPNEGEASDVRTFTFTTGTETAPPLPQCSVQPPALKILSLAQDAAHAGLYRLTYQATPAAPDEAGLSLLEVYAWEGGGPAYRLDLFSIGPADPVTITQAFDVSPGEEICLYARQRNAAGAAVDSEPACETVPPAAGGCQVSQASGSGGLLSFAAMALGLWLARRRRAAGTP
jgi:uncharacterized protein (TIGR03382 family)